MKEDHSILLAEDEQALGAIIAENLVSAGFQVTHVLSGVEALSILKQPFSLIILDVMMPGMTGFDVARKIRQTNRWVPILFLTSRTMTQDVVDGFESGGNDYLRKPFAMQELVVRIKALISEGRLLKKPISPLSPVEIGLYKFDPVKQQLQIHLRVQSLTSREAELLWLLYENRQELNSKKKILEAIWGDDNFFNSRTLDVFITKLRKHLHEDREVQIINVRGVGYKLVW